MHSGMYHRGDTKSVSETQTLGI